MPHAYGDVVEVGQSIPFTCGCGHVPKRLDNTVINCTSMGLDGHITELCQGKMLAYNCLFLKRAKIKLKTQRFREMKFKWDCLNT